MRVDPVAFGSRLAELRRTAGLTPAQAARRAGVTASYWSVIEGAVPQGRNKRASLPRIPVVRALADAVDANKADLLDLAGYTDNADLERARVARLRSRRDRGSGSNVDLESLRLLAPDLHAAIIQLVGAVAALAAPQPDDSLTRAVGDCTSKGVDVRSSSIPSLSSTFVPERVQSRRESLRALHQGKASNDP